MTTLNFQVQQAVRKLCNKPKGANMAAKPAQAMKEHAGGDIHAALGMFTTSSWPVSFSVC